MRAINVKSEGVFVINLLAVYYDMETFDMFIDKIILECHIIEIEFFLRIAFAI